VKLQEKYDIVIIGSGLGGLTAAIVFAKEGYSVCVLEKNNQYGGNLQTFVRDKTIFDTGVHYLGGLEEGQNLYQYFKYLGIMDDLKLQKLDNDFDLISFEGDDTTYTHAQGYTNYNAGLKAQFPEDGKAIDLYCDKLKETTEKFPMYCVKLGKPYYDDHELFELSAKEYIESITDNKKLRAVLAGSNLLYAGQNYRTPFYVHALSIDSYIQSSYRCVNGGSQISKFLIRRLIEQGGHAFKHQEVVHIECEHKQAISVTTAKGNVVKGDTFISNVDPKYTLDLLDTQSFRKSYVKRIRTIESTIAAFTIHVVLKPGTFPYKNHNYYHYKDEDRIWDAQNYTQETWPEAYMISMGPSKNQNEFADSFTAMTYMHFDEMKPWEETFNTVADKNKRGETYEEFKSSKSEKFLSEIERKFPNIRECIEGVYASTPLSFRDYIGCNGGSMYGYAKDVNNPLSSFISPRTRIGNLLFTGQSLNMHGILGVTISGIVTSSEILGKEYLLNKVWEANKTNKVT